MDSLSLLNTVANAYARSTTGEMDNAALFEQLVSQRAVSADDLASRSPVGKSGAKHSLAQRRVRWHQQTLRRMGLLERDPQQRGVWRLTGEGKQQFVRPAPKKVLLGFSTDLGVALWSSAEDAFAHRLDVPIFLALTSPPYPLAKHRAYSNPTPQQYVDFICGLVEPIVKSLARGGSLVLNVTQDVFESGSPARSTYLERMVIALCDRLGLSLMDRLVWSNPSKPPGPVRWSSIERVQLNVGWEPVLWFTNDPSVVNSNNRNVLLQHTERHQALMRNGGEQRDRRFSDGAYNLRAGASFSNETAGRIPRNVLSFGHACAGQQAYKRAARALGLPVHGAPMPESLARFLVQFLTEPGQLVVDFCAGSQTVPAVCEELGRPWLSTELMGEYIRGGAERFRSAAGFQLHDDLVEGLAGRTNHPTMAGQQPLIFEGDVQ
jgi:site-specific DNA-methyltransferase (cytosine-N4-specific)